VSGKKNKLRSDHPNLLHPISSEMQCQDHFTQTSMSIVIGPINSLSVLARISGNSPKRRNLPRLRKEKMLSTARKSVLALTRGDRYLTHFMFWALLQSLGFAAPPCSRASISLPTPFPFCCLHHFGLTLRCSHYPGHSATSSSGRDSLIIGLVFALVCQGHSCFVSSAKKRKFV
jgi:hypothetical protein